MEHYKNKYLQAVQNLKKQKRITKTVILLGILSIILLAVLLFFVNNWFIALFGGLFSTFIFSFWLYRGTETHKALKNETEFYSDLIYSEYTTEEVEFIRYANKVTTSKKQFNSLVVKRLKTDKTLTLLYETDYDVQMEKDCRYIVTNVQNMLIDYKKVQNEN